MNQNERQNLSELEERVEQVFSLIETLPSLVNEGKARRQLLEELFRTVHSLKALAQTQGRQELATLAHACEDILHSLRTGRSRFDDQVAQLLAEVADVFFKLLSTSVASEKVVGLLERVDYLLKEPVRRQPAEVEIILKALPSEIWQSLNEEEKHRLHASIAEGANLFLISTNFDLADFDRQFQQLKTTLTAAGELISTSPIAPHDQPGQIDFRILYAREAGIEEVQNAIRELAGVKASAVEGISSSPVISSSAASLAAAPDIPADTQYIRVNVEHLDQIISSAYSFGHEIETIAVEAPGLEPAMARLQQLSHDLAAAVVNLRMMPIRRVLHRVERAGRTAARLCGKEIEFQISGEDLELDQSLCKAITDPLIHLVRNAVDHGIEPADHRLRVGKPAHGKIALTASTVQGQTQITVSDDGRGIDPSVIAEASLRLGLALREPMTLDESVRLIFRPGFSTASEVSETSGRGVGLDVVEKEIERFGGQIRVSSRPGEGATFEIRLPLTFGLLDVVTVRVGNQRYLIDTNQVVEPANVGPKAGAPVEPLKLGELLGQESSETASSEGDTVLFCELKMDRIQDSQSIQQFSLLVDEVENRQRVVIRSLGVHASRWFGVAGATELRNGTVALLLDLVSLIKNYWKRSSPA